MLANKVWPHLETLHIGDFAFNAECLKEFIQSHKRTLRELTLRKVKIFGQKWADAAKEMGGYLRLRRVSVLGVPNSMSSPETASPYLEDLAVARSFMQSIPRTTVLDEYPYTIIACPVEGEVGHLNDS